MAILLRLPPVFCNRGHLTSDFCFVIFSHSTFQPVSFGGFDVHFFFSLFPFNSRCWTFDLPRRARAQRVFDVHFFSPSQPHSYQFARFCRVNILSSRLILYTILLIFKIVLCFFFKSSIRTSVSVQIFFIFSCF